MTRWRVAVSLSVAWIITATAHAWSPQGHRLVALVATNHLTPAARQSVSSLLGDASLADVAVWADQYLEGNNQTSFWHYVNIPLDASSYDRDRDCPTSAGGARQEAETTAGVTASSIGSSTTRNVWRTVA